MTLNYADRSPPMLLRRVCAGEGLDLVFVLVDPAAGPADPPEGSAVVVITGPTALLRRWAVADDTLTGRLLAALADELRAGGARRLEALPAGATDRGQLLALGFRPHEGEDGPLVLTL